ncbi:MAG: AEC family transporter [Pseudomonadota bacterium]|nr:AEC family transporter [Pseudomonadota bacterium]
MNAMVMLLACLAAGIILQRAGKLPDNAPAALNAYVINVALPALALTHLHKTALTVELLASAAGAWLMLGAAALFIGFVARRMKLGAAATGALILTGGLANTSFVGLPMIEAWIGRDGLPYGIVIDQLGSYLALSTFGLMVAARYSGQPMQWSVMWHRILTFPPLIALVIALVLRPVPFHPALEDALGRIGATVAPIALFAVGCQLRLGELWAKRHALALGLGFKLVLGPLLIAVLCLALLDNSDPETGLARTVVIFEAAMGPMIGAAVVANHYKLDSGLTSLMVGIGVPMSLLIAPLWLNVANLMT